MSHFSIPASKVLAARDEFLSAREERINNLVEVIIAEEMSAKWFRAKTREAAIRRRSDSIALVKIIGGSSARKIAELKSLAEIAGDGDLLLSPRDAFLLKNFL